MTAGHWWSFYSVTSLFQGWHGNKYNYMFINVVIIVGDNITGLRIYLKLFLLIIDLLYKGTLELEKVVLKNCLRFISFVILLFCG